MCVNNSGGSWSRLAKDVPKIDVKMCCIANVMLGCMFLLTVCKLNVKSFNCLILFIVSPLF